MFQSKERPAMIRLPTTRSRGSMTDSGSSQFSAADSALGYLYQVRIALLFSLRHAKETDFLVSLETLDDVTFESTTGDPQELLQTKHHQKTAANLTDASPDLWKSLRVWIEAWKTNASVVGTTL